MKLDFIYCDDNYLFSIKNNKIDIYSKDKLKKQHTIYPKYTSKIISDIKNNIFIVTTTATEVYVYDYKTFDLVYETKIKTEAWTIIYDYNKGTLFLTSTDLETKCSYINRIDVLNKNNVEKVFKELYINEIMRIEDDYLLMFSVEILGAYEGRKRFFRKYDCDTLDLVSEEVPNMKSIFPHYLYKDWCYENQMKILENMFTGEVITYDELGIEEKELLWTPRQKTSEYFVVDGGKHYYIFDYNLKIIKKYYSNIFDIDNPVNIGTIFIDNDKKIYITKNKKLIIDEL